MYRIQILHPDSGLYLNTSHESNDLEALKSLLSDAAFAGPRFQIVDDNGEVHFGPTATERSTMMTVEDLARSFGVPIVDTRELGLIAEPDAGESDACTLSAEYSLEVIHEPDGIPVVWIRIEESQATQIMDKLWPHLNFWSAPGGSSMVIETAEEAEIISKIVGRCWITFRPDRHRLLFHACLT